MKDVSMIPIDNQAGFTLIEVLIAVFIFTVGILSVNAMQIASIKGNFSSNRISQSTSWATGQVEYLLGLDYNDTDLDDDDGDGTDQDLNGDGVDDDGENFGLDDIVSPDGSETSPDGQYTIYWNVAPDYPLLGIKTVKITVNRQDRGESKVVSMIYMKADSV